VATLMEQVQVNQERAETDIEIEKARRVNLVAEEKAKVYEQSDRAYELERLRLLQGVIGSTDKVYFVPEGADLTLILGGNVALSASKTVPNTRPGLQPGLVLFREAL